MKIHFLAAFLIISIDNAKAVSYDSLTLFSNNFLKFAIRTPNVDSAYYFVKKLSVCNESESLLNMVMQDHFSQLFIYNHFNRRDLSKELLMKILADSSKLLQSNAEPINYLVKFQDNSNDVKQLTILTHEFIDKELLPDKFYNYKSARYGLLMYKIINEQSELKPLAKELFNLIYQNLKDKQIKTKKNSKRVDLEKQAWYRYLYAYSNYIASTNVVDSIEKEILLKMANDFSPNLSDKENRNAYFYDMTFLGGKESYQEDYLIFIKNKSQVNLVEVPSPDLVNSNPSYSLEKKPAKDGEKSIKKEHKQLIENKNQVLETHLKMALVDPNHKEKLREYYNSVNSSGKTFESFWLEAIDNSAKPAYSIALPLIDKTVFSSKDLLGKWILLDFWGTWCSPCRAEHPEFQIFYDSTVLNNRSIISFLTIACHDNRADVLAYMKEKHFSFPVAMADDKIETEFAVQSYPSKILISPKGKYITIPFGIDWRDFIKKYCGL